MQPQEYRCIPHQGLNGGWQTENDINDRRRVIDEIVDLMQRSKPDASEEWLNMLPPMAKRLEEALYRSSYSSEEYNDMETLKPRLQQLANNILMIKTKGVQAAVSGDEDVIEITDEVENRNEVENGDEVEAENVEE